MEPAGNPRASSATAARPRLSPQKGHGAHVGDCRFPNCPFLLRNQETAKAGDSRRRSQWAKEHALFPPQAPSKTPCQQLRGWRLAGSGLLGIRLHAGLAARGWVPLGLVPALGCKLPAFTRGGLCIHPPDPTAFLDLASGFWDFQT